MVKQVRLLFVLVGLLCLMLGVVYFTNLPGFTRDATPSTRAWGLVVGIFAFSACIQSVIHWRAPRQLVSFRITILALGVAQLPPAILWWAFRGSMVTDAGGVGPLGQWQWSAVHVVVMLICGYLLTLLNRPERIAA